MLKFGLIAAAWARFHCDRQREHHYMRKLPLAITPFVRLNQIFGCLSVTAVVLGVSTVFAASVLEMMNGRWTAGSCDEVMTVTVIGDTIQSDNPGYALQVERVVRTSGNRVETISEQPTAGIKFTYLVQQNRIQVTGGGVSQTLKRCR